MRLFFSLLPIKLFMRTQFIVLFMGFRPEADQGIEAV